MRIDSRIDERDKRIEALEAEMRSLRDSPL